jgi:integrase
MPVHKLPSGRFQARATGPAGESLSATFDQRLEAQEQLLKWKRDKREGRKPVRPDCRFHEFFDRWYERASTGRADKFQSGWRESQLQYFNDYFGPVLGSLMLREVRPHHIEDVLHRMAVRGKAPATQRLVYATMKKVFSDAIELYDCLSENPVKQRLRPAVPTKEAPHLSYDQSVRLLRYVDGKRHGLAIWLQLGLGLRVGEVLALRWEDLDLEGSRVFVRRAYVRRTNQIRDYPKGGKQLCHMLPEELLERLKPVGVDRKGGDLVVTSRYGNLLPYRWYLVALRRYCREAGVPRIGTHGLRHSTAELYMRHGATRDDLQQLFGHSSLSVTDRYVHGRGTNLETVGRRLRLVHSATESTTENDHVEGQGAKVSG